MSRLTSIFALLIAAAVPTLVAQEAAPPKPVAPEETRRRAEREALAAREQAERNALAARDQAERAAIDAKANAERAAMEAREQVERASLENAKLDYDLKRSIAERAKQLAQNKAIDTAEMEKAIVEMQKAGNELRVHEARLMELRATREAAELAFKVQTVAEPWKADINKALERKVSFEFVDTPLNEACEFIRHISNVNLILDPKAIENGPPAINLRVADMKLADALSWVCKLTGQRYELRNQSVFITPDVALPAADPKKDTAITLSGKLRVKLANGNEFEADSTIFSRNPDLVAGIVEQTLGVTDRRVEGIPVARDNPALAPLRQLLAAHARNDVSIEYHQELGLLLISGKNPSSVTELYRLAKMGLDAHRNALRERPNPPVPAPTPAPSPKGPQGPQKPPAPGDQF